MSRANIVATHATCDYCGRSHSTPPSAPHKRFCSTACRNAWHGRRRQEAYAALRAAEQSASAQEQAVVTDSEQGH